MALSCIVCEIQRVIGRKSRNVYTQPVFSASTGGDSVRILQTRLVRIKVEWLCYRTVKNKKLRYRWQTARCCFVKLLRYIAGRFVRKRRQEVHNTSSELLFRFWYYHLAALLQLNSTLQLNPFIVPISMLTHPPLTSLQLTNDLCRSFTKLVIILFLNKAVFIKRTLLFQYFVLKIEPQ